MAFSRLAETVSNLTDVELTAAMVGIGMRFAATPEPDANIEATLMLASEAGMEQHDLRVLAVLTTWLGIHHPYVNADRLSRLVQVHASRRVRVLVVDRKLVGQGSSVRAEVARGVTCSFATAWQVTRDFRLLEPRE